MSDGMICGGEFAGPNACTCGSPESHESGDLPLRPQHDCCGYCGSGRVALNAEGYCEPCNKRLDAATAEPRHSSQGDGTHTSGDVVLAPPGNPMTAWDTQALEDEIQRHCRWLARFAEMTNDPRLRAAIRDAQNGREVPEDA